MQNAVLKDPVRTAL